MSLTQSGDQETTFEGQIPNDDDNEIEILSDTEAPIGKGRITEKANYPSQCKIRSLQKAQKNLIRTAPLDSAFLARERRLMELERQQIAKERLLLEREKKLLAREKRQAMASHYYPIVHSNPSPSDQHQNTPSFSETIFPPFIQENLNADGKQRSSEKSPTVREYLRKNMVCQKGGLSTPPALRVFKQRKHITDQEEASIPRSINILSNRKSRLLVGDSVAENSRFIRNGCHLYRVESDEESTNKCLADEDEIKVVYDSANVSTRTTKIDSSTKMLKSSRSNKNKSQQILIKRTLTIQPEITNIVPLNLHALLGSCQSPDVINLEDDEKSI